MNVIFVSRENNLKFEVIERKGKGHPDNLTDSLAEQLSIDFSKYTQNNFGAILHHNFDKVSMMGGSSEVEFGNSRMIAPIRVLLNGRATSSFGNTEIPVRDLLENTVYNFFEERFSPYIEKKDIRILYEVSTASTPGAVCNFEGEEHNQRHTWHSPRTLDDLPELKGLNCNDTAVACYVPPASKLSKIVLGMEDIIHSSLGIRIILHSETLSKPACPFFSECHHI